MSTKGKFITVFLSIGIIIFAGWIFFKFFFVYSEGINEGDINYFQREGFVFKTYEGKMIQSGYTSKNAQATIQSNEFKFSVEDPKVAQDIDNSGSRSVKLHWKRYLGALPWRGNSQYIVDSVIVAKRPVSNNVLPDIPQ